MRLLPYDKLLIHSPLPVGQAEARLRESVGPERYLQFNAGPLPFLGEVNGTEVRIHRSTAHENSFVPRIHARLEVHEQGSRLAGTMSLHPFVLAFLVVWVTGTVIALRQMVARASRGEPASGVAIPIAMLAFMYLLTSVSFWWEADVARRHLKEILSSGELDASGVK
ncbi:hypothetical protein [Longimicrobium terrae]|uniref:Uncharacterized protein n=1 Tax=Longimicrobium terrae TaxID=1639882 RepID=A0A841GZE7_9BACT|nr:hypothetical protein [Longimicrobium terrae]MBB4636860.1 hypothetical protein [Longimicrobium terrae]MBB6071140.1 hypothetical protein [Longimicrobium terrae]NNC29189.1 hypothetical protein [Longimicrobium terrae]